MSISAKRPQPTNVMIPNHVFGALVFVFVEMMFYSAMVSSFFVMRRGRDSWGQADALLLPRGPEFFNGLVLAISVLSVFLALRAASDIARTRGHVLRAFGLGLLFTIYQVVLAAKGVANGLTLTSSVFSGTMYLMLGSHALQALIGTAWLGKLWIRLGTSGAAHLGELRGLSVLWGSLLAIWSVIYVVLFL